MNPQDFIAMMAPAAQQVMGATGIPASFTIAQGAVESAWFNSALAKQAFNLFGIKADASWQGAAVTMPTEEVVGGKRISIEAAFRKYPDLATGLADHAAFLKNNPRYAAAFVTTDGCAFARAVARAGYATDPNYAQVISEIIDEHGLMKFDVPVDSV